MRMVCIMIQHIRDDETIIAQCTPRGNGALALIRISGISARSIANNMSKLPGNKRLINQESHTVHYGWVIDHEGKPIDQVLFIVMDAPRTFTGQDTIEITCHNNQFLIEAIIEQAISRGARLAQPGEFTRRAFMLGKIDLIQAEAINELIQAQTQMALKKSLAQLDGSFSYWVEIIEKELIKTLAWCEASFEFLDEEGDFGDHLKLYLDRIFEKLTDIKKTFNAQQQIRQGVRIALIGSVNAGKSSLFNMLLNQKRSIVTDIAGTTRDSIEAGLYRNGNYWTLIDTAGLRSTNDSIEQAGIQRSLDEAHSADIIILVLDGSRLLAAEETQVYQNIIANYGTKVLLVQNKCDLPEAATCLSGKTCIKVSSMTGAYSDVLEQALEEKIIQLFAASESPFLVNQRQYNLLMGLERRLHAIQTLLTSSAIAYELVSYHLKDALECLSELTGKTVSEVGMNAVFKEFCVGK